MLASLREPVGFCGDGAEREAAAVSAVGGREGARAGWVATCGRGSRLESLAFLVGAEWPAFAQLQLEGPRFSVEVELDEHGVRAARPFHQLGVGLLVPAHRRRLHLAAVPRGGLSQGLYGEGELGAVVDEYRQGLAICFVSTGEPLKHVPALIYDDDLDTALRVREHFSCRGVVEL